MESRNAATVGLFRQSLKERLNWEQSVEMGKRVVNYDTVMRTTRVKEEDEAW